MIKIGKQALIDIIDIKKHKSKPQFIKKTFVRKCSSIIF